MSFLEPKLSDVTPAPGTRTTIGVDSVQIRACGPEIVADLPRFWDHITVMNQTLDRRHMGTDTVTLSQILAKISERESVLKKTYSPEQIETLPDNLGFVAIALSKAEAVRKATLEKRGATPEDAVLAGAAKGQAMLRLRAKREAKLKTASSDGLTNVIREVGRMIAGKPTKASRPVRQAQYT